MSGLLGKKIGMIKLYNEIGEDITVTAIKTGPCDILQKKTEKNDGYEALQICYEDQKEKRLSKAVRGHYAKAKVSPKRFIREFRVDTVDNYEIGKELNIIDIFKTGQYVDVKGISKGKGFAGTVKRHGFKIGPMTHGSRSHRAPGSIGQCAYPGKVFKGKKMPGRMGGESKTVQNLKIIKIDNQENLIFVKGAIPGPKGNVVEIKPAIKKQ